jgi:hypothetical protein
MATGPARVVVEIFVDVVFEVVVALVSWLLGFDMGRERVASTLLSRDEDEE